MNISLINPTKYASVGTGWDSSLAGHPPPLPLSQSPRSVLEKLLSGQTERQFWGDGIPESDSRMSGGGAGGPDGQYFRLFSAFSSGQDQSSRPVGALRFSPASLPQEISVWVCDAHYSSSSSLKLKISVQGWHMRSSWHMMSSPSPVYRVSWVEICLYCEMITSISLVDTVSLHRYRLCFPCDEAFKTYSFQFSSVA